MSKNSKPWPNWVSVPIGLFLILFVTFTVFYFIGQLFVHGYVFLGGTALAAYFCGFLSFCLWAKVSDKI